MALVKKMMHLNLCIMCDLNAKDTFTLLGLYLLQVYPIFMEGPLQQGLTVFLFWGVFCPVCSYMPLVQNKSGCCSWVSLLEPQSSPCNTACGTFPILICFSQDSGSLGICLPNLMKIFQFCSLLGNVSPSFYLVEDYVS